MLYVAIFVSTRRECYHSSVLADRQLTDHTLIN